MFSSSLDVVKVLFAMGGDEGVNDEWAASAGMISKN